MYKYRVLLAIRELLVGLLVVSLAAAVVAGPSPLEYLSWNDLIYDYELPNNVAPLVTRLSVEWSDPRQAGGYDPWDPLGNAFAVGELSAALQRVWDDDGVPNHVAPPLLEAVPQFSDPRQPGGYDPWDPIGNAFGLN